MTDAQRLTKYRELVEDIREAMLVTEDQSLGALRSRPMHTAGVDDDGTLWFFTKMTADKVQEIYHERQVNVAYANPEDKQYVSASGPATIVDDPTRKRHYYSKMMDAWFDGPDDPQATLIKVATEHVEYWDDNDSSLITMAKIALAAVTPGGDYSGAENERLDLER